MSAAPRGPEALAELASCRDEIEQIDRQIVALLARRLTLGRRTGELKRLAGLPILDPTREAAVIRRVTGEARDVGLPPEPIREVFWQIVGMSRQAQQASDDAGIESAPGGEAS
ncbi:MAG: chorismate mutase [Gemmatimonadaceae bacterium]